MGPGEGKFYGLEARLQLYPTLSTGTIMHKLPEELMWGRKKQRCTSASISLLLIPDLLIPLTNRSKNTVDMAPAHNQTNGGVNKFAKMTQRQPNLPAKEHLPTNISPSSTRRISKLRTCCCQKSRTGTRQGITPRISSLHSSL